MTFKATLAAAAIIGAAFAGMPEGLGQQRQIATRPGSGIVAKRDRPTGFWGDPRKHVPRVQTPEQRRKHLAKMERRFARWHDSLTSNPCIPLSQYEAAIQGCWDVK